jgi:tetratricopeptide (TPR) repeat protein
MKMTQYIWIGIILLGQCQLGLAQPKNTLKERDSLLVLLDTLKNDTQRIDALSLICQSYRSINPAQSLKYMHEANDLAKKINHKQRIFGTMISLGYAYGTYGESVKSIQILQEATKLATKGNGLAIANTFIGRAFLNQNDFENALKYIKLGYDYYREEWKNGTPTVDGYAGGNMSMGEVYLSMGRLDSAFYYLQEGYLTIKKGNRNRYFAFHIPLMLGTVHLQRKEGALAFKYFQEGLQEAQKLNDNVGVSEGELGLAQYYNSINRSDSMTVYALSALKIAQKIRAHKTVLEASSLLKMWCQQQNSLDKALYYKTA